MIHRYQLLCKIANRLSYERNRLWRVVPLKLLMSWKARCLKNSGNLMPDVSGIVGNVCLDSLDDSEKCAIIDSASKVLRGEYDLLGSGSVYMPGPDWHCDFKSGFTWHEKFYRGLRGVAPQNADIKVPWELSRSHHLLWLGEAYLLTGKEEYAAEVVRQLNDWIERNPLMYSVNWTCAMDVAIRAINWIYALSFIQASGCLDDAFVAKVQRSLFEHGFFIWHNLEKNIPDSNNHYFSDIVGLLYLGRLFRDTKCGAKWWKFGIAEFYKELRSQTLPSGANYERSVSYHRLMTELASYPIYMLKRAKVNVPEDIEYRVYGMYRYVAHYTKPNGMAPLVEDNDNGRLLPFVERDFRDHGYLNDVDSAENRIIAADIGCAYTCNEASCVGDYRDAGNLIMRNREAYLFVTNGRRGCNVPDELSKRGVHTHNDLLSFELALGHDDLILDPGAYLYTSDVKSHIEFRSTRKHNTIIVDGEEQHLFPGQAFVSVLNSIPQYLKIVEDGVVGEYTTIKGRLWHERAFSWHNNSLVINDRLEKAGSGHSATMSFHLAPGIVAIKRDDLFAISTEHYDVELKCDSDTIIDSRIIEDTVSTSYGILQKSTTIEIDLNFDNATNITTYITWKNKLIDHNEH